MLRVAAAVLAGAGLVQCSPALPEHWLLCSLIVLALPVVVVHGRVSVLAFILGVTVMSYSARAELASRLPDKLTGKHITLSAQIIDFPLINADSIRLSVEPLAMPELPSTLRINWYGADVLPHPGETWRFEVRLKRPRGFANPGGFDFEKFAHRARLGATGYVVPETTPVREDYGKDVLGRVRARVSNRLASAISDPAAAAVAKALAVGDRSRITPAQWEVFAATGTSHLMAISGLHIGLAAAASLAVFWGVGGLLTARANIRDLAVAASCGCALVYAALSGFATPAQRAVLMLAAASVAFVCRRRVCPWQVLSLAALLVWVIDPLSIYAPGFVLSFTAVAILLLTGRRIPRAMAVSGLRRGGIQLASLQLALLFGMLAFSVAIFGRVALLAPLANIVVVPLFSILVVPPLLLGLLLDGGLSAIGDGLIAATGWLLQLVLRGLHQLAAAPVLAHRPTGVIAVALATLCALRALLPPGFAGREVGVVALLALLTLRAPRPPVGCFDLRVLDVGQGLAVVIETRTRNLLYDTGPAGPYGSAAESVVEPYFSHRGVHTLDRMIVSHADLDHAGGQRWLLERYRVAGLWSGEPAETGGSLCNGSWTWDGVLFSVLHPRPGAVETGNNASCVVEVSSGQRRILLTGDIEARVEHELSAAGILRPVDLVVVPHHGSRTSSTSALIKKTRPAVAIVATGYANRWGFPKPDVTQRWNRVGATVLDTGRVGSVVGRFCGNRPMPRLWSYRTESARYWHDH